MKKPGRQSVVRPPAASGASAVARIACAAVFVAVAGAASARAGIPPPSLGPGPVYWIPIDDGPEVARGMIDPWMSFFVRRYVAAAKEANASVIVFAIKTYGGSVDSAIEISNSIRSAAPLPTVAFVDNRAISAGALVALACDWIYMEDGSSIGAAQGVLMGPEGGREYAGERSDKEASFLRTIFRAHAERRGKGSTYPESIVALAEAMTDPDVAVVRVRVDGEETYVREKELSKFTRDREAEQKQVIVLETVIEKGKLLTMTAREAYDDFRFIDGVVTGRAEFLSVIGKTEADVVPAEASWPQEIARFIGGPFLSGLLISIAMLGLLMELWAPGKGIGGFIFLFGISLFFWSRFLAGQAGPVEVVLFLAGIALLAVEVFLIPGFGVAGVTGIILVVGSLVLAFLPGDIMPGGESVPIETGQVGAALLTVLASLLVSVIGVVLLARFLPHVPLFKGMVLEQQSGPAVAEVGAAPRDALARFVGKRGVAITDLRPSGKAEVMGEPVDVVAEAEFLEKGEAVEVREVVGNRVVVARARGDPAGAGGRPRGEEA